MSMSQQNKNIIQLSVTVPVSVTQAFNIFTEKLNTWWPREYTWSGDVLETIGMETQKGGRCFEIGPHGFTCDWGRILDWQPPEKLVFSWQISPERVPEPNPEKASEVEVRFKDQNHGTLIEFMHRGFEKHGENGSDYCQALNSPQGWPYILDRFVKKASE